MDTHKNTNTKNSNRYGKQKKRPDERNEERKK